MQDLSRVLDGQMPAELTSLVGKFLGGQHTQVPDQQVHQTYGQLAAQLPPDKYVQAAEAAFQNLSPEQRTEFAQMLQTKAQQYGLAVPTAGVLPTDPAGLASAIGQVHGQGPGLLQQMFAPDGIFSNPIAKSVLLGVAAMAAQRLLGGAR